MEGHMGSDSYKVTLDENSGIPVWLQLRNQLAFLIVSGAYKAGDKLPTVREMAADLGVNYNTVLKVCQFLEQEGYIVSKRGKGTFVADISRMEPAKLIDEADLLIDQFISQCVDMGLPLSDLAAYVQRRIDARGSNE